MRFTMKTLAATGVALGLALGAAGIASATNDNGYDTPLPTDPSTPTTVVPTDPGTPQAVTTANTTQATTLAFTGADIAETTAVGAALVTGGVLLFQMSRRRRVS